MIKINSHNLFYNKYFFIATFLSIAILFNFIIFKDIFFAKELQFCLIEKTFTISNELLSFCKISYMFAISICWCFWLNILYSKLNLNLISNNQENSPTKENIKSNVSLTIGQNLETGKLVQIPEKGLYQNILITGTIGTGKTSSAMYPFTNQLLKMNIGMLILDVKGNFHKKLKEMALPLNRNLIILELRWKIYL